MRRLVRGRAAARAEAARLEAEDRARRDFVYALVDQDARPNFDAIMVAIRDLHITKMNIKAFGYDLARRLEAVIPAPHGTTAQHVGLHCKPSTQADIESAWAAHWFGELHLPVLYHRKLWETAYILQAIHEAGCLAPGVRGLAFGCGLELTPSYLASRGVSVLATDLAPDQGYSTGWAETQQHAAGLDHAFHEHIVDRATFDARVDFRTVDMNAIPDDLTGFDFCWSTCALEHIGSIRNGLDFIENSLRTIRPGGLSVHTTELNIDSTGPTVDNWPTVLFQRHHIEALAARLRDQGHHVAELSFDYGDKPMDLFIDVPPWPHEPVSDDVPLGAPRHLKLSVDGFPCTCYGIIVRKKA